MEVPDIFVVTERIQENSDTVTLAIAPINDQPLTPFTPGQFNMLYRFGVGEVPISFSGSHLNLNNYHHTIRMIGKTTEGLAGLQVGQQLGVRGPFGRGWPMAEITGKQLLIIAGGIGLAPLQPIIEAAVQGSLGAREVQLFYGAKSPQALLFQNRLPAWRQHTTVQESVDSANSNWHGHIGVITQPLAKAQFNPANTLALICGPEIMMRFAIQTLQQLGLPERSIYLSMERNMHCAIGHCGHCQWGPHFICKDGPVFNFADIADWFYLREL